MVHQPSRKKWQDTKTATTKAIAADATINDLAEEIGMVPEDTKETVKGTSKEVFEMRTEAQDWSQEL